MPYKIRFKGSVEIECDTVDEVISIAHRLADTNGKVTDYTLPDVVSSDAGIRLTTSRFQEFVGFLDAEQRKFLALLVESPDGKTDHNLRQALGLSDNKQLGGMMSGISKLAKKAGFSIGDILSSQWVKVGDKEVKELKAEPGFSNIARNLGGLK